MKKHNFSAGPSILPQSVFEQASKAVLEYNNEGLSLLEMSHRSAGFDEIITEARDTVRKLYELDDRYEVLFLTGGASSQFFMVPMNLLAAKRTAAYINTGTWSTKAIKEVSAFGKVHIAGSSEDENFSYIPQELDIPSDAAYLHLTSNNTISGTQFQQAPTTDIPLVVDASSDLFSGPLIYKNFDVLYAGAQKNLGPAGVTLVIVNKEKLGKVDRSIPTMLDYQTHVNKQSMFNTPPTFPIYVCLLTMRWIIEQGGLAAMADRNAEKAKSIYDAVDASPIFNGVVRPDSRSKMNVTFRAINESVEQKFLEQCNAAHINGIKGHRSVGGFRASIYNAMPQSSVNQLVTIMQQTASLF